MLKCTFSDVRKKRVGAEVKHTLVITKEEEDQLWQAGVMEMDTSKHSVFFFYIGKVFCLGEAWNSEA